MTTPLSTERQQVAKSIKILTEARGYVAKGWIQHDYHRRVQNRNSYCAIGALRRACGGGVIADYPDTVDYQASLYLVVDYLERGIARKTRKASPPPIIAWNDSMTRTQDQVLDAYDFAIKRAERDLAVLSS